jgi:hypothetical protein
MESKTSYSLAVVAAGTALIVLFVGAGVIVSLGHTVPDAMWAAAAGLSGALVGILIPTSGNAPDPVAKAAAVMKQTAAAAAAATTKATEAGAADADPASPGATGARNALAAINKTDVTSKVTALRNAVTPVSTMVDEIVGMFTGPAQAAQTTKTAADHALSEHQKATAELQTAAAAAGAAHQVQAAASEAAQAAAAQPTVAGTATDATAAGVGKAATDAAAAAAEAANAEAAAAPIPGQTDPAIPAAAIPAAAAAATAAVQAITADVTGALATEVKTLTDAGKPVEEVVQAVTGMLGTKAQDAKSVNDAAGQKLTAHQQKTAVLQRAAATATAAQKVHQAAATAAEAARPAVAQIAIPGDSAAAGGIGPQTRLLVAVSGTVFVCAMALTLLIAAGVIHAGSCSVLVGQTKESCDSSLQSIGTAMLTLASSAGGVLLGLFATPDGKPAGATAGKATM